MVRSKAVYVIRNNETGEMYNKAVKGDAKTSVFAGAFNIYNSFDQAQQVIFSSDILRKNVDNWKVIKLALVDGDDRSVSNVIATSQQEMKTIKSAVNDFITSLNDGVEFTAKDVAAYVRAYYEGKMPLDGTISRYIRIRAKECMDVESSKHHDGIYRKVEWVF